MFRLSRLIFVLTIIALPLVSTPPAFADESACEGSYYDQGAYEFFTPELRYVPPPLRVAAWDCATRLKDRPFGFDTGSAVEYVLVYADVDFDVVVHIARAFEEQGWLDGYAAITSIDTGDGMHNSVRYSADQLAALDSPPLFAGGRFGNAASNHDIISLSYADGVTYFANGRSFPEPSLVVSVSLTEPFADVGLADPSVLSGLKSVGDVHVTPAGAAVVGGAAIMLTLVIGYPGTLLNSVIGPIYDRTRDALTRAWATRKKKKSAKKSVAGDPAANDAASKDRAPTGQTAKGQSRPKLFGWLFIPGLVIAAIISGFVDPSFGFNAMSARVLVTAFLSLLVFNVAAWSLVRMLVHRWHPDAVATIKFRWGSLILVVIAVLIARLLDFNPGVIFGLVAGLVFATTLSKSRDALVTLLGAGFGLAVALLSWLAFSVLSPLAAGATGSVLLVFATEFFSAITIAGVASLPLSLLPLLALDGHKLFAFKKWLWALSYAIGLLAFMLVLLTIPDAWGEIAGDFVRWLVLFGAFGLSAVAVWALYVVHERRKARAKERSVPG